MIFYGKIYRIVMSVIFLSPFLLSGSRLSGVVSGISFPFRRATVKCIAMENSSTDNCPSLSISDKRLEREREKGGEQKTEAKKGLYQIADKSAVGNFDLTKNVRA